MTYQLNTPFSSTVIYLNSKNCTTRQTENGGSYKFYFNSSLRTPLNTKFLLSVIQSSIPNVYNNINKSNNLFSYTYNNDFYTIEIDHGRYDVDQFRTFINQAFSDNGHNIVCSYDKNTFKLSFKSAFPMYIINTKPYPTTCSALIGVNKNGDNEFNFPVNFGSPAYTIKMPSMIDFSGTKYIFIVMGGMTVSNLNSTGNLDNTLVRIPVNCNRGSMIFYRPSEVVHYIVERQNLHSLEFFIKDDDNQDLILDGHDFQIQLKIDVIYPPQLEDLEEGTIIHKLKSQEVEKKTEDNKDGLGVN